MSWLFLVSLGIAGPPSCCCFQPLLAAVCSLFKLDARAHRILIMALPRALQVENRGEHVRQIVEFHFFAGSRPPSDVSIGPDQNGPIRLQAVSVKKYAIVVFQAGAPDSVESHRNSDRGAGSLGREGPAIALRTGENGETRAEKIQRRKLLLAAPEPYMRRAMARPSARFVVRVRIGDLGCGCSVTEHRRGYVVAPEFDTEMIPVATRGANEIRSAISCLTNGCCTDGLYIAMVLQGLPNDPFDAWPPLKIVRPNQLGPGPPLEDQRQFPHGVLNALETAIDPQPAGGRQQMRGVAADKDPATKETLSHRGVDAPASDRQDFGIKIGYTDSCPYPFGATTLVVERGIPGVGRNPDLAKPTSLGVERLQCSRRGLIRDEKDDGAAPREMPLDIRSKVAADKV